MECSFYLIPYYVLKFTNMAIIPIRPTIPGQFKCMLCNYTYLITAVFWEEYADPRQLIKGPIQ